MRPDEHKKKKNAAYKKKHGIGQTKPVQGEDKSKQKKGGQSKDSAQTKRKDTGREVREGNDGATQKREKERAEMSSSDSETDGVRQPRKTFQRRQIVSNWQKYELTPEDEEKQGARGESFEKLLSMSGDAVAHFRFKDEQEWDVVGALADSKISDDHYTQYLNIDTQQIGQAMNCLPLYKVLGLNPEFFPNDERELMETAAAENRQVHWPEQSAVLTSMSLFSSLGSGACSDNKHLVQDGVAHSTKSNSATDNGRNQRLACPADDRGSPFTNDSHAETMSPADRDDTRATTAIPSSNQKLVLQDEDLDSLLELDTPADAAKFNDQVKQAQPSEPSKAGTTSKGINSVSTTASQDAPVSASNHKAVEKPEKDGVDLEDWLDSILDD